MSSWESASGLAVIGSSFELLAGEEEGTAPEDCWCLLGPLGLLLRLALLLLLLLLLLLQEDVKGQSRENSSQATFLKRTKKRRKDEIR